MQRALTVVAVAVLSGVAWSLSYINWGVVDPLGTGGYTVSTPDTAQGVTYLMQPDGMGGYTAILPQNGPPATSITVL
jgi:hypothetical protein